MSGSGERFLLAVEKRRRSRTTAGLLLAGLGLLIALVTGVVYRLNDPGPPPPELLRPFVAYLAVLLLLLGLALWARLHPLSFVRVDPAAGTVTVVRKGIVLRDAPLPEVGPLRHTVERRRVKSGKTTRIATLHVARSEPFPELLIVESEDELVTRRALESRAKAWGVPYVKPTGESRSPEELDVPIFQRLGGDEAVTSPLPRTPNSMLEIAWKDGGYEISTSFRPPIERVRLVLSLLVPAVLVVLVALVFREPVLGLVRADVPTPFRVFGGLVLLSAFAPGVLLLAKGWLRSIRPPVIRISAETFRFRGKTLPLRSVEEVERVPGAACRLVSDKRIVEIDADFCEPFEHAWLHHEVRRLVIEAGLRTPAA